MSYLEAFGTVQWQLHEYAKYHKNIAAGAGLTLLERVYHLENSIKARDVLQELSGLDLFPTFLGRQYGKEEASPEGTQVTCEESS